MEADIAQIKLLLWIILALLVFFVTSNILCRIFKCGEGRGEQFAKLWDKGKVNEVIDRSRRRLQEHPHDVGALYFGARALSSIGMYDTARGYIKRLVLVEPTLLEVCQKQLEAIDKMESDT